MTTVAEIFETLDYGPAPESDAAAQAWLEGHGRSFGHFIDGKFTPARPDFPMKNPASGEVLAQITQGSAADIDNAVAAARAAQPGWAGLSDFDRARHLYALARGLQKHARLFAVLESLDSGKPIREARDIDIPLAARHFSYHAGMAQLRQETLPDRSPLGVCGQIVPWNFPLLMLAWKIAPALAMGNTIVLKPAEWTPLTALRFAELARDVGLQAGVVNIVTGDGETGAALVGAEVDKIAFTGSTEVGRRIAKQVAGRDIPLTLELGGKSPFIVFEDADLDSAVEGVVDAVWFNGGQVCCAGSRLLVQEGIAETFHAKLKARMDGLRMGDPLDKCIDLGSLADPEHHARVSRLVTASGGTCYQPNGRAPDAGCFFPPTLITDLSPADPIMQEEVFGPVLVSATFRTPDEAVQLANNTRYGLAATLWSENINRALHVAQQLDAGVIWVNGTNMFDATAPFGGMKESGYGREGGWAGLRAYTKQAEERPTLGSPVETAQGQGPASDVIDRTAKLTIGGKQTRPDGGGTRAVLGPTGVRVGEVPEANRKDIRNAVEAARKAKSWGQSTGHLRAQILAYFAENLAVRRDEFAHRLEQQTSVSGEQEVSASIERLFSWAAWADKYEGRSVGAPARALTLALPRSLGVIAAFGSEERPLLSALSLIGACLAMGNRVVFVAPETAPLSLVDLMQVADTSDIPPGSLNLLTGAHQTLAPHLAGHADVNAIWSFSHQPLSKVIEEEASAHLTRTWVNNGKSWNWDATQADIFCAQATETQTIWLPYGD